MGEPLFNADHRSSADRCRTLEATRTSFRVVGIALTVYDGVVRLSAPKGYVPDRRYEHLRQAFARCG